MILPFCYCGSLRWGEPQCPSFFVLNGHRHRCCSMAGHPDQHFSHCYAPICVAEWTSRLPASIPRPVAVAAISLTWAADPPPQEQPPLLIPWRWPEAPRLA